MMTAEQTEDFRAALSQFVGSYDWTRWNPVLFKDVIASEGMMYVADKAAAYWLLDAIASHESCNPDLLCAARRDAAFDFLHFWTLTVDTTAHTALLVCQADLGKPLVVRQDIEYTDFPLAEFKVYAGNDGRGTPRKLFLPSEY